VRLVDDPETRVDPPLRGTESETLLAFLSFHRETLRRKTAGLTQEQLAATAAASTMTLGGMLKHLALVEDHWFSVVHLGREQAEAWRDVDWDADPDWEWRTAADDSPEELRSLLDSAVARSEEVVREALAGPEGLDALSARESGRGDGRFSLRWILVHMIEEYCRHNGHADLIRESIDGQRGE
jgi:uncharacterized damage-inducible protein DinB